MSGQWGVILSFLSVVYLTGAQLFKKDAFFIKALPFLEHTPLYSPIRSLYSHVLEVFCGNLAPVGAGIIFGGCG